MIPLLAVVLAGAPAGASPKDAAAKRDFDKGVAAYKKGDFATTAQAMADSFAREADPETLFAWAQAERKLDHCDKAIELYVKLLGYDLPAENKHAIEAQLAECKQIVAAKPAPVAEPAPSQPTAPKASDLAKPDDNPLAAATPPPKPRDTESRPWWRDPVGDTLVGVGVAGAGVGVAFLVMASSANSAKSSAPTYQALQSDITHAHDRGEIGVIGLAAGGALIVGGIVWYATHGSHHDDTPVTGWLSSSSGGVAFSSRF